MRIDNRENNQIRPVKITTVTIEITQLKPLDLRKIFITEATIKPIIAIEKYLPKDILIQVEFPLILNLQFLI